MTAELHPALHSVPPVCDRRHSADGIEGLGGYLWLSPVEVHANGRAEQSAASHKSQNDKMFKDCKKIYPQVLLATGITENIKFCIPSNTALFVCLFNPSQKCPQSHAEDLRLAQACQDFQFFDNGPVSGRESDRCRLPFLTHLSTSQRPKKDTANVSRLYADLLPDAKLPSSSNEVTFVTCASNACYDSRKRSSLPGTRRSTRTEPRLCRRLSHRLDHDAFSLSRSASSLPASVLHRLWHSPRQTHGEAQATPPSTARTLVQHVLGRVANRVMGSPEETSPIYAKGVCARAGGLPNISRRRQSGLVFPRAHFGSQLSPESPRGALNHSAS